MLMRAGVTHCKTTNSFNYVMSIFIKKNQSANLKTCGQVGVDPPASSSSEHTLISCNCRWVYDILALVKAKVCRWFSTQQSPTTYTDWFHEYGLSNVGVGLILSRHCKEIKNRCGHSRATGPCMLWNSTGLKTIGTYKYIITHFSLDQRQ